MAILYFITYAAYAFYALIPSALAFALMVLFTVFTVAASVKWNRQVIAHIGMVGAYAVPFLLDDGSGRIVILMGYVALINCGILAIAFLKWWKVLYYSSFTLTWLIFLTWYIPGYLPAEDFHAAMAFSAVYFTTFYVIFLAYKLIRQERHETADILMLLVNSGIFYGIGYASLHANLDFADARGLFTLGVAVVHFIVAWLIWLRKPVNPETFYFVLALGLAFLTITVPVQLDGNWVTLLWSAEAAALFYIGRTKNLAVFELLACLLLIVLFFSIIHDWQSVYGIHNPLTSATGFTPLLNIHFLTSMAVAASCGFILYVSQIKRFISPLAGKPLMLKAMNFCIPAFLIFVLYFAFIMEISCFWRQLYAGSLITLDTGQTFPQHYHNDDLLRYRTIALFNFTLVFFSLMAVVNVRFFRSQPLGLFNLCAGTIALGLIFTFGLQALGDLRNSYAEQYLADLYYRGPMNIGIRYVSFSLAGLMLLAIRSYVRSDFLQVNLTTEFDFLLHTVVLTVLSNELITWIALNNPGQSYKLGLSILFGVYSLLLILLGIRSRKAYLRYAAIALFGATLLKLVLYDLSYLSTIAKTIVFVILGVLLLIISFLYNKYKAVIFDSRERNDS
jgi:uncharacterized membrane protein